MKWYQNCEWDFFWAKVEGIRHVTVPLPPLIPCSLTFFAARNILRPSAAASFLSICS